MKERLLQWDDLNKGFRENVKSLRKFVQKFKERSIS